MIHVADQNAYYILTFLLSAFGLLLICGLGELIRLRRLNNMWMLYFSLLRLSYHYNEHCRNKGINDEIDYTEIIAPELSSPFARLDSPSRKMIPDHKVTKKLYEFQYSNEYEEVSEHISRFHPEKFNLLQ